MLGYLAWIVAGTLFIAIPVGFIAFLFTLLGAMFGPLMSGMTGGRRGGGGFGWFGRAARPGGDSDGVDENLYNRHAAIAGCVSEVLCEFCLPRAAFSRLDKWRKDLATSATNSRFSSTAIWTFTPVL